MKCIYCQAQRDLRPYGPRAAMVCFACAMKTPEREREAKKQFAIQLEASGPVAAIDGSHVGPYPARHYTARKGEGV